MVNLRRYSSDLSGWRYSKTGEKFMNHLYHKLLLVLSIWALSCLSVLGGCEFGSGELEERSTVGGPAVEDSVSDVLVWSDIVEEESSHAPSEGPNHPVDPGSGSEDTTPPPAPVDLHVGFVSSWAVWLPFTALEDLGTSGLKSFRLYRDGIPVKLSMNTLAPEGGASLAMDYDATVGLEASTTYRYWVSAVDNAGNESLPSNEVSVRTEASIWELKPVYRTEVLLLHLADFSVEPPPTNQDGMPVDPAHARDLVFDGPHSLNAYLQEVSYGKSSLSGTVRGWYKLPGTARDYGDEEAEEGETGWGMNRSQIWDDAMNLAQEDGMDISQVDRTILVIYGMGATGYASLVRGPDQLGALYLNPIPAHSTEKAFRIKICRPDTIDSSELCRRQDHRSRRHPR